MTVPDRHGLGRSGSTLLAGIDGCRAGWLCLARAGASRRIEARLLPRIGALLDSLPHVAVAAIDIPIGLTAAGPRGCDVAARRLLGRPRSASVFPAPIRPALEARTRAQASRITSSIDGRGVGAQAWNLYARIREVDAALRDEPRLAAVLHEAHPEVSFAAWNRGRAMLHGKKTPAGRRERLRLVESAFGLGSVARIRSAFPLRQVAAADILDAFALLWTAARIRAGIALSLPEPAAADPTGAAMRILF